MFNLFFVQFILSCISFYINLMSQYFAASQTSVFYNNICFCVLLFYIKKRKRKKMLMYNTSGLNI